MQPHDANSAAQGNDATPPAGSSAAMLQPASQSGTALTDASAGAAQAAGAAKPRAPGGVRRTGGGDGEGGTAAPQPPQGQQLPGSFSGATVGGSGSGGGGSGGHTLQLFLHSVPDGVGERWYAGDHGGGQEAAASTSASGKTLAGAGWGLFALGAAAGKSCNARFAGLQDSLIEQRHDCGESWVGELHTAALGLLHASSSATDLAASTTAMDDQKHLWPPHAFLRPNHP